jgi:hypothetical protein
LRRLNALAAGNLSAMIENTVELLVAAPTAKPAAGGEPSALGRGMPVMPARRLLPLERLFLGRRVVIPGAVGKHPLTR